MIDIEKKKNIIARLFIFCIKVLIKGLYEIKSCDMFSIKDIMHNLERIFLRR